MMIMTAVVVVAVVAIAYAAYKHISLSAEFAQLKTYVQAELAKLKPSAETEVKAVVAEVVKEV